MLNTGEAIVVRVEDVRDSATYYLDSGFDVVRRGDVLKIVNEVNSSEYPDFKMVDRNDGSWTLYRR